MGASPSTLPTLTYKKNSVSPSATVVITPQDTSGEYSYFGDGPWVKSKPDWLNVVLTGTTPAKYSGEIKAATFKITVKESIANQKAKGNYNGRIAFLHKGVVGKLYYVYVSATLEIQETVVLKVTPNPLEFNVYNIGEIVPPAKFLTITSENSWTAHTGESWIILGSTTGSENGSIEVNVDVTDLTPGNYTGTIEIDDGKNRVTVQVILPVRGEIEPEEYLNITPSAFDLSEIFQEPPTKQKAIKVDSSESFTLTDNVGWLSYSAMSGGVGITSIVASTINTETLPIGTYPGTITIKTNSNVKTVSVLLRITLAEFSGIVSNGFYYADDRNNLVVTNAQDNSEVLINFTTEASSGQIRPYSKKAPYVENIATIEMGLETNRLLRPNPFLSTLNTRVFVPVAPLKMDFTVYDKIIGQSPLTKRSDFSNVQFINGRTPKTPGRLTYIPNKIAAIKDGLISFSFKSDSIPDSIDITGAVTTSLPISGLTGALFTCFIDLSDFTLNVGDKIKISCGPIEVDVQIKPNDYTRRRLIWLNEWQMPESFDFTGHFEIENPREVEETTIDREGQDYTKIIDISEPEEYSINTGNLYSQDELDWLMTILRSKLIYLEIEGEMIEVVCTTKKLSRFQTREFNKSYALSFKKASI
ncbi:hypothetical protein I215_01973 [Galbibacter marinus]|uniref:BACON domain-containing protein n=1 Tax=Galbibacter marinus TaxID=555500 RepID=K2Q631_9FLAO|nr:BACON domain-containing protein [Galbibacter marinus]EKF56251.1 hypothetical protein I215_01973 [Galbibacter marinus]